MRTEGQKGGGSIFSDSFEEVFLDINISFITMTICCSHHFSRANTSDWSDDAAEASVFFLFVLFYLFFSVFNFAALLGTCEYKLGGA